MLKLNTIYNMNCLEGMKLLDDSCIDLVCCDLPYGTTNQNKWDHDFPLEPMWEQYQRILKPEGSVVLTSQMPFSAKLYVSKPDWYRFEWIWEKKNATGFLNTKQYPLKAHENIMIFSPGRHTYNAQMEPGKKYRTRRKPTASLNYGICNKDSVTESDERHPRSVLTIPHDKKEQVHSTQKPVALIRYFIETYSNPSELVLDNCMGSGTCAVACIETGREYIGFEIEADFVSTANERASKATLERRKKRADLMGLFEERNGNL